MVIFLDRLSVQFKHYVLNYGLETSWFQKFHELVENLTVPNACGDSSILNPHHRQLRMPLYSQTEYKAPQLLAVRKAKGHESGSNIVRLLSYPCCTRTSTRLVLNRKRFNWTLDYSDTEEVNCRLPRGVLALNRLWIFADRVSSSTLNSLGFDDQRS